MKLLSPAFRLREGISITKNFVSKAHGFPAASLPLLPPSLSFNHPQEAAKEAAKELTRAELSELKGLKTCPQGVDDILNAVVMVLNHDVVSYDSNAHEWADLKKKAGDPKIIAKLKAFDAASMTLEESERIDAANFDESATSSSTAALKFLRWLQSTQKAFRREGILEVDPKRPLGVKLTKGLAVQSMSPEGQFDVLGALVGDTILSVGTTRVASSAEFTAALKHYKAQGGDAGIIIISLQEGKPEPGKLKKSSSVSSMNSAGGKGSQKERPNSFSTGSGAGTSLDHGTARSSKTTNRAGSKSSRKPSRPAPKVVADANEPASFAPKEFGSFRAKGTSIGAL